MLELHVPFESCRRWNWRLSEMLGFLLTVPASACFSGCFPMPLRSIKVHSDYLAKNVSFLF